MHKEEKWTILKLIDWSAGYFKDKGIDTPRLDAELLLAQVLKTDRTRLYMNFDQPLSSDELADFRALLKRRANHEPLQYISGHQEFWSMEFEVTPAVLIPRPETELLVEEAIKEMKAAFHGEKELRILDIGAGSGALTAALAKEIKGSTVTGIDISPDAVNLAQKNIDANGLSSSVEILKGDLFGPVEGKKFHLIVSNPPYIPHDDLEGLQPEVSKFEPLSALDGGADGLDYYRRIIPESIDYLHPGGWLMVEHGEGQSESIIKLCKDRGKFEKTEGLKDLAGILRVVKGRKIPNTI